MPLTLPCPRCGRPVQVEAGSVPDPARCLSCGGANARYLVRLPSGEREMDGDSLLAAVQRGEVSGLDWAARVSGGRASPIASHPDFRQHFARGLSAPPPSSRKGGGRSLRVVGILALLALGAAGAGWLVLHPPEALREVIEGKLGDVRALFGSIDTSVVPGLAREEAPPAPAAAVAQVDALVARVGPVEEPRQLLLAEAWAARVEPTDRGMDTAIQRAERAVARDPSAPDALGLLAELYSEAGREPELAAALVAVARAKSPDAVDVRRASACVALAANDLGTAVIDAEACLAAAPGDLACRALVARLAVERGDAGAVEQYGRLVADWPENGRVLRSGAIAAVLFDAPDAPARLSLARKRLGKDPALAGAAAILHYRDGEWRAGAAELGKGVGVPTEALLLGAAAAIAEGNAASAGRILQKVDTAETTGSDLARLLRLRAQAAVLAARSGGSASDAQAAVAALVAVDRRSPVSVQARIELGRIRGESGGEALEDLERKGAHPEDLGAMYLSQGVALLERKDLGGAQRAFDAARALVPQDPAVWLGLASASAGTTDVNRALDVLSMGLTRVDGRTGRTPALERALPVTVPVEPLAAALEEMLSVAGREDDLGFGRAAVATLSGKPTSVGTDHPEDPARVVMHARTLLATDAGAALAYLDEARERLPREPVLLALTVTAGLKVRRPAPALEAARTLVAGDPNDAWFQILRAQAADAAGEDAMAKAAAIEAARLDPRDPTARRLHRAVATG